MWLLVETKTFLESINKNDNQFLRIIGISQNLQKVKPNCIQSGYYSADLLCFFESFLLL